MARPQPEQVELTFGTLAAWAAGVLVIGGLVYWRYITLQPAPPMSGPEAARVADLASFRTFNRIDDGWVAVLAPDWPGVADPGAIKSLCDKLTERLAPMDGQTIEVLGPEGEPLRNCQGSG